MDLRGREMINQSVIDNGWISEINPYIWAYELAKIINPELKGYDLDAWVLQFASKCFQASVK
jgi:hypothetical protein